MAKTKERKALRKGKASFNLIGQIKVTDKTFNLDNTYDSGWTDNSMYVGVDCGNGNVVYAEMRSGFFPDKDNTIRTFSKDDKDETGKSKSVEIAWEDRLDESLYDSISDFSFITVGIEKDVKDKTVYKKFLTAYDAVAYLSEHLEDGMIVNIRGNLGYQEYEGNVSCRKDITSIALSRAEDESEYKATFSQSILVDSKSIGKKDDEKNTIELNAYVVDYVGKPKINGSKVEVKQNVVFPKTFEVAINEKPEITAKMLAKFFKPKKGQVTELTVVGDLVEGGSVVNITEADIPDDIKELIEMGIYSEEEAEKKCAVGNNGNRERRMIVLKPDITYVGTGDERKPTIAFEDGKYDEDDLYFYEQALLDAGANLDNDSEDSDSVSASSDDDDLLAMLEAI